MGWETDKAAATAAFKTGASQDAANLYSSALGDAALPAPERAVLLANRAAAYLKLNLFEKVIEDCTACLMHSPSHVKALYRRCVARLAAARRRHSLPLTRAPSSLPAARLRTRR